jgi:hypothetical protein
MRQKRAFAPTAALHKYTAEPLVCLAAAEIADSARRSRLTRRPGELIPHQNDRKEYIAIAGKVRESDEVLISTRGAFSSHGAKCIGTEAAMETRQRRNLLLHAHHLPAACLELTGTACLSQFFHGVYQPPFTILRTSALKLRQLGSTGWRRWFQLGMFPSDAELRKPKLEA